MIDRTASKVAGGPVDAELLREAGELELDLPRIFEDALRDAVAAARRARWLEENRDAIDAYNRHVERDGVFADGVRGHRRASR
jgi:antitoxin CcdA